MTPTELDGMAVAFDRWIRVVVGMVGLALVAAGVVGLIAR